MQNDEQKGSGGRKNWPVAIGGGVGAGAGVALGFLVVSLADLRGLFWPGITAAVVGAGVGAILGQLAVRFVFQSSPHNPSDSPPNAER